jgi:hypothetical protein
MGSMECKDCGKPPRSFGAFGGGEKEITSEQASFYCSLSPLSLLVRRSLGVGGWERVGVREADLP